jgi:hypothetical protein
MTTREWVSINAYGLLWDFREGKHILGRIVMYCCRGGERAELWRAIRAGDKDPHNFFSLKEAVQFVEGQ